MIYTLARNLDRIPEDGGYDAELLRFPGWESVSWFYPDVDERGRGAPSLLEYTGDLDALRGLDYPYTPNQGLLVSRRLVGVLLSVRPFAHELFPARVYSHGLAPLLRDEIGHRTGYRVHDPSLYTDDFAILKLTSFTDCLDKDRTTVDGTPFSRTDEEEISFLQRTHYAFREPPGGFPPVFVTPEISLYGWSEEAKAACERAGLKGLRFRPVK